CSSTGTPGTRRPGSRARAPRAGANHAEPRAALGRIASGHVTLLTPLGADHTALLSLVANARKCGRWLRATWHATGHHHRGDGRAILGRIPVRGDHPADR